MGTHWKSPHGDFCGNISLFQDCFLVSPFPLANSNHNVPQFDEKAMLLMLLWLCLVHVKVFPENISFFGNVIFRKGKCFHVFGCQKIRFTEN